jgi:hypothetical protein
MIATFRSKIPALGNQCVESSQDQTEARVVHPEWGEVFTASMSAEDVLDPSNNDKLPLVRAMRFAVWFHDYIERDKREAALAKIANNKAEP